MKKLDTKGFGVLQIIQAILLVGAIGGAGFYVYSAQNEKKTAEDSSKQIKSFDECVAAGNPVMESFPEQCSVSGQTFINEKQKIALSLDKSKLPQGWNVTNETANVVSLDNSAIDLESSKSCFVEVQHVIDDSVKAADKKLIEEKLRSEYAKQIQENKGYITEALPDTFATIQLVSEQTNISSFYDLITLPASEYGMYEKTAFIVEDGAYVTVKQSCQGTDFSESAEALLAITIRL